MKPVELELHHDCRPVGEILNQIGGKWTVLIINLLSNGPMRFSAIKRMIGGISQKVLTATLRDLEMDGFVTRTVTPSIPPRVDYELTELGRDLQKPLEVLGVDAFKASEVTLRFRIKTLPLRQWDVGRELRRRIKKAFDAPGILIPGPQMTVTIKSQK